MSSPTSDAEQIQRPEDETVSHGETGDPTTAFDAVPIQADHQGPTWTTPVGPGTV
jgi:hypothetical protein